MPEPSCKDDTNDSLGEIAERHGVPIISLMLESEKATVEQAKSTKYIESLEVFRPRQGKRKRALDGEYVEEKKTYLDRKRINAFTQHNYVAVSYTWRPSEHEFHDEAEPWSYLVEKRGTPGSYDPSPVRNTVPARVINYMRDVHADTFWIDQHSIEQNTDCEELGCRHASCNRKAEAIRVVDLVYEQSKYPLALLGRVVGSTSELKLLYDLMKGKLTTERGSLTGKSYSVIRGKEQKAEDAFHLLKQITSDLWWKRAWTFQENYRGGKMMILLMRHDPSLEMEKRGMHGNFGHIEGELQFDSVEFSRRATELCLALNSQLPNGFLARCSGQDVKSVLATAGRYKLLLDKSESMSTEIVANVNARDLQNPSDRLDIIANCCQYSLRMDWREAWRASNHGWSLSAALMAQYLINGEIMDNGKYTDADTRDIAAMPIAQALKRLSFKKFQAPLVEANRSWCHHKQCRFLDVKMTPMGVAPRGHLWELGTRIYTNDVEFDHWVDRPRWFDIPLECCRSLKWLSDKLNSLHYDEMAQKLDDFIDVDYAQKPFSKTYMSKMAMEVYGAIQKGKVLRLGRLWQHGRWRVDYSAVFVMDNEVRGHPEHNPHSD